MNYSNITITYFDNVRPVGSPSSRPKKSIYSPKPKSKRRSQFRMKQADLETLYHSMESVDLLGN